MTPMVPAIRTVLTPQQAIDALVEAHLTVIGGEPPGPLLEILCAQSALETAKWQSMWNWNFGNIRGQYHGAWTSFRAGETNPDGSETMLPPGPGNMFRAYPGASYGAEDFVSFLGVASHPPEPNRYQEAWDAATQGDAEGYVAGLKAGGYFTAQTHTYFEAIQSERLFLRPYLDAWKT